MRDQVLVSDFADLEKYCRSLISELSERTVILLDGALGVGKTKTVEWIAKVYLNSESEVASPTFAFHHHYEKSGRTIDHFDLYRVSTEEEIESTGFWDVFQQERGLVIVEWAERLNKNWIPRNWTRVEIEIGWQNVEGADQRLYMTRVTPAHKA